MARSDKASIGYFSIDIDMNNDEKIEYLLAEHGLLGKAVIIELYSKIYGSNGYYIDWNDRITKLFVRNLYLDLSFFNDVLDFALNNNIFDKNIFDKYGILTSKRIQKNYFIAAKYKKEVDVFQDYLLVKKNVLFECIIRKNQILNILDKKGTIIEVLNLEKKEDFNINLGSTEKEQTEDGLNEDKYVLEQTQDELIEEEYVKNANKSDFQKTINYNKLELTVINLHCQKNPDLFFKKHVIGIYPKGKCRSPETELNFLKDNFKNWKELLPEMHYAVIAQNRKREYDFLKTGKDQMIYVKSFKNWLRDRKWEEVPEVPDDDEQDTVNPFEYPGIETERIEQQKYLEGLPKELRRLYDEIEEGVI